MKSVFFISDVHLREMASPDGEAILALLRKAQREASHFIILGDLFDLWVGKAHVLQNHFAPLIEEVKRLSRVCKVIYLEGNHDFHLKTFWQDDLGCEVSDGPLDLVFGKTRVRLEHGDENNPDDKGYLFLRRLLRRKPIKKFLESVPSLLVKYLGGMASNTSRRYHELPGAAEGRNRIKEIMRAYAKKQSEIFDFDLMVTGHTHVADDISFHSGKKEVRMINLGSWFEGPHFLRLEFDGRLSNESGPFS